MVRRGVLSGGGVDFVVDPREAQVIELGAKLDASCIVKPRPQSASVLQASGRDMIPKPPAVDVKNRFPGVPMIAGLPSGQCPATRRPLSASEAATQIQVIPRTPREVALQHLLHEADIESISVDEPVRRMRTISPATSAGSLHPTVTPRQRPQTAGATYSDRLDTLDRKATQRATDEEINRALADYLKRFHRTASPSDAQPIDDAAVPTPPPPKSVMRIVTERNRHHGGALPVTFDTFTKATSQVHRRKVAVAEVDCADKHNAHVADGGIRVDSLGRETHVAGTSGAHLAVAAASVAPPVSTSRGPRPLSAATAGKHRTNAEMVLYDVLTPRCAPCRPPVPDPPSQKPSPLRPRPPTKADDLSLDSVRRRQSPPHGHPPPAAADEDGAELRPPAADATTKVRYVLAASPEEFRQQIQQHRVNVAAHALHRSKVRLVERTREREVWTRKQALDKELLAKQLELESIALKRMGEASTARLSRFAVPPRTHQPSSSKTPRERRQHVDA